MKNKSIILQKFIALFLAVAVINIYVTDSYCSFTKETDHQHSIAITEAKDHYHDSAEAESSEKHHHRQTNEAAKEHHHDKAEAKEHHHDANEPEAEHHNNGDNDDNCCKDETSTFFTSLINPSIHSVLIKSPVSFLFYPVNSYSELLTFNKFLSAPEYLLFRPPPNIPDIRVFIQSFII